MVPSKSSTNPHHSQMGPPPPSQSPASRMRQSAHSQPRMWQSAHSQPHPSNQIPCQTGLPMALLLPQWQQQCRTLYKRGLKPGAGTHSPFPRAKTTAAPSPPPGSLARWKTSTLHCKAVATDLLSFQGETQFRARLQTKLILSGHLHGKEGGHASGNHAEPSVRERSGEVHEY